MHYIIVVFVNLAFVTTRFFVLETTKKKQVENTNLKNAAL